MWSLVSNSFYLAQCFHDSSCYSMHQHFIPFYCQIVHCMVQSHPILFMHLSVHGYLSCFYLLAVTNNAAMTIHGYVFMWMQAFCSLGYIPKRELLDHIVTLCLTFEKVSNCFPKQLYPFIFPPTVNEGSNFSTCLSTLVIFFFCIYGSHSNGSKMVFHCGFGLNSLMISEVEPLSMSICISFLETCLFKSWPYFSNRVVQFFCC